MGSGNASRVTQHRNQRETEAKEKAQLKRENKALRKQLTRMRRQLQKMMETYTLASEVAQEIAQEAATIEAPKTAGCEKCGSHSMTRLPVPSGILVVCKGCHHRKKVTS
jgi:formylmethanofuran dehydrogenase subunit E